MDATQVKKKIANVEGALGGTHNYLGITEPVRDGGGGVEFRGAITREEESLPGRHRRRGCRGCRGCLSFQPQDTCLEGLTP